MEEVTQAITWEAPEHHHIDKGSDWFWALGIIAVCASIASFFFGNFLFAILILIGAFTMALLAARRPEIISFSVSTRGIRLGDNLFPYSSLDAYFIDEESPLGVQLLVRSKRIHMPLIILPLPPEFLYEIEELLFERLPEDEIVEPFANKILEFFGF